MLKKHARSQEEKIKRLVDVFRWICKCLNILFFLHATCRMATKLLRLTSDGKKEAKRDGQPLAGVCVCVCVCVELI